MFRRSFLQSILTGAAIGALRPRAFGQERPASATQAAKWNAGSLRHLLPTVSHDQILIKASFDHPLKFAPILKIDGKDIRGSMSDTHGEMWRFHATGLRPGRRYQLALTEARERDGSMLCEPWHLGTFPAPDDRPERVRILLFTCAGGHEEFGFLPTTLRSRLFRRALSFAPDAAIANGDHVYWDLRAPRTARGIAESPLGLSIAGRPNRAIPVLGTDNERFLKATASPQIVPVYGTDFRSTPMFFIQDDHDYYDNDEATDDIVLFPPDHFMMQMARSTQRLYYPEFLPDPNRPSGLPGASEDGLPLPVSESFGTLRYGRLLEMLLYTVRRTMTMAGPSAVFLEPTVEGWLRARMASTEVDHVINVPSNPPGWTAGKWGEWYPDILERSGQLTIDRPKPYWQTGWVKQHDRLLTSISSMRGRIPLVISGDLHASAIGRITRTGEQDLSANPVIAVLSGTIGTGDHGWPSHSRGVGAQPSLHIHMEELVKPVEQHGFTLADFTQKTITLHMFKWDKKSQPIEAIDTLEPFYSVELPRHS